jgi:hypothetical protein
MYYLIYKITNRINNKIYIGCHKTEDKDDGYMGSGVILKRAYEKYGETHFEKEILFECKTEDEMFSIEEDIVNEEFVARLDTYNIALGGKCGSWYYSNKYGHNTKKSKESGKKGGLLLREKLKDEEFAKEFSEKISAGMHLYYKYNDHAWIGRHHSEESKKKIGKANSIHQQGSKNSNYGNCWIPKKDLKKWLDLGWKKGRKVKW